MKPLFTLIFCLIMVLVQAQTFEELIQQADQSYKEEKYSESAEIYQNAFKIKEGSAYQYYNAACSFALSGNKELALNYLSKSTDKGWMNVKHLKRDKDLASLHDEPEWERILEKVQANLDVYEKDFDKPLKAQLENIYVRDQTLRQLYREAEEKFGEGSDEMNYFWQLVSEQDSLNELEVVKILEERGWVGRSQVGGQANMALWLVIQHAPVEMQEKYLPLLKASVLEGESQGSHLAMLEDRVQMFKGEPQTYGSQIVPDEVTGKMKVYEIREPEYVNQRRKEVGLGPIEEYVRIWNIEWTVEQKEK
ncbi:DUF6624 domain-containing protein [Shivajiella indica]|uniref:DUF6624 domain-containing protein n=1 Tax=Shivajiella indica TaxID=872115 RepID=A0ABW5B4L3_9BACT